MQERFESAREKPAFSPRRPATKTTAIGRYRGPSAGRGRTIRAHAGSLARRARRYPIPADARPARGRPRNPERGRGGKWRAKCGVQSAEGGGTRRVDRLSPSHSALCTPRSALCSASLRPSPLRTPLAPAGVRSLSGPGNRPASGSRKPGRTSPPSSTASPWSRVDSVGDVWTRTVCFFGSTIQVSLVPEAKYSSSLRAISFFVLLLLSTSTARSGPTGAIGPGEFAAGESRESPASAAGAIKMAPDLDPVVRIVPASPFTKPSLRGKD